MCRHMPTASPALQLPLPAIPGQRLLPNQTVCAPAWLPCAAPTCLCTSRLHQARSPIQRLLALNSHSPPSTHLEPGHQLHPRGSLADRHLALGAPHHVTGRPVADALRSSGQGDGWSWVQHLSAPALLSLHPLHPSCHRASQATDGFHGSRGACHKKCRRCRERLAIAWGWGGMFADSQAKPCLTASSINSAALTGGTPRVSSSRVTSSSRFARCAYRLQRYGGASDGAVGKPRRAAHAGHAQQHQQRQWHRLGLQTDHPAPHPLPRPRRPALLRHPHCLQPVVVAHCRLLLAPDGLPGAMHSPRPRLQILHAVVLWIAGEGGEKGAARASSGG